MTVEIPKVMTPKRRRLFPLSRTGRDMIHGIYKSRANHCNSTKIGREHSLASSPQPIHQPLSDLEVDHPADTKRRNDATHARRRADGPDPPYRRPPITQRRLR